MFKLRPLVTATLMASTLCVNAAVATPPTGQFTFEEHARAQSVQNGSVRVPIGTDVFSSTFTLLPGSDTGWRMLPGEAVLAITQGVIVLQREAGCAREEYRAGQAFIVSDGRFRIRNAEKDPAEFAGAFFNLPAGGSTPLVEGPRSAGPTSCAGADAHPSESEAPGVLLSNSVRGTTPAQADHHAGQHGPADLVSVEASKDVLVTTLRLEPGFSTGWFKHTDHVVVVTRGVLTYYEGRDGKCVMSDRYVAGEAYYHSPHVHMAVNEGEETLELTAVNFNLRHGSPLPVVGSQAEANDFSPLPPTDCPRVN